MVPCLGNPIFGGVAAAFRVGWRFAVRPIEAFVTRNRPRVGRWRSKAYRSKSSTSRLRNILRSLRCRLRTKERYPGLSNQPRHHHFHSSLTPPHAHHTTRKTLRVDLVQTGAAPTRPFECGEPVDNSSGLCSGRIPMLWQQTDSTRLLWSTVEKCLAFATGQKNRPAGRAVQVPKESSA
jgi:hypothetical protein